MAEQTFLYAVALGFFVVLTIILFVVRKIRISKKVRSSAGTGQNNPSADHPTVSQMRHLTRYNEALLKYSEDVFMKSIGTINDFSKSMITLVSGLFAVYFALLKFLGIEDVTKMVQPQTVSNLVALPPIFFIISLIAFVFSVLPLTSKISFNRPKKIERMRKRIFIIKYIAVIIGILWLVLSMLLTIHVFLSLLNYKSG